MAASHIRTSSASGSPVSLSDGADNLGGLLLVIDFLIGSGTAGASDVDFYFLVSADPSSTTLLQTAKTVTASTTDTLYLDFNSGFPCLNSGLKRDPATSITVEFGGPASSINWVVGWHYERPGARAQ